MIRTINRLLGPRNDACYVMECGDEDFLRVRPYVDPRDPNPQPAAAEKRDTEFEREWREAVKTNNARKLERAKAGRSAA